MKDIDCHFILSYLKKVEKVDSRYRDLFVDFLVTEVAQNHLIRLKAEEILASSDKDYKDSEEDYYEEDDYEDNEDEDYGANENEDYEEDDYEDNEEDDYKDDIEDVKYNW